MRRFALPGSACALALAVVGCGPMASPMPPRFDPESQAKVDAAWDRAFTPADRYDRQGLLDVMVGTQAYQQGVDTFLLRAEKRFAGGKVVMEVAFDRARPDEDRFEVTVSDAAGKVVRRERFTREEVEQTYEALFVNPPPPRNPNVPDNPGMAARRAEYDVRWQRVLEVFPDASGQKGAGARR